MSQQACEENEVEMPHDMTPGPLEESEELFLKNSGFSKKAKQKRDIRDLRKFKADQVRLMKPRDIKHPFDELKITNSHFLNELTGREMCSRCGEVKKIFLLHLLYSSDNDH